MFHRSLSTPAKSFFLFGPRGTGKSTWLKEKINSALTLDLLKSSDFLSYSSQPDLLIERTEHLKPGAWFKGRDAVGDGAFRRLAQKVNLELVARIAKADCLGREPGRFDCTAMDWFLDRARALGVEHRPPTPLLLGRHLLELGVAPGPRMGDLLRTVYELQLDGAVMTLEDAQREARKLLS